MKRISAVATATPKPATAASIPYRACHCVENEADFSCKVLFLPAAVVNAHSIRLQN